MLVNYIIPLIITIIFIVLYVTLCTIFLKNRSEKIKMIPIQVIFFILIILEFLKIFYLITINGEYQPLRYPVVFCSMVMYAYPIFCFKKNRFSDLAMGVSILPMIFVFILFVAIQWQYEMDLMQIHSYFYHGAMMAVAAYLLTSGLYKFEFKKYFPIFLVLSGYVVFCTVLSLFIGGDISYFGPECDYLGFIYDAFGYVVGNLFVIGLIFVLCIGAYGIIDLCEKKHNKKVELKGEVENA